MLIPISLNARYMHLLKKDSDAKNSTDKNAAITNTIATVKQLFDKALSNNDMTLIILNSLLVIVKLFRIYLTFCL